MQNGFVKSSNGRPRDECLDERLSVLRPMPSSCPPSGGTITPRLGHTRNWVGRPLARLPALPRLVWSCSSNSPSCSNLLANCQICTCSTMLSETGSPAYYPRSEYRISCFRRGGCVARSTGSSARVSNVAKDSGGLLKLQMRSRPQGWASAHQSIARSDLFTCHVSRRHRPHAISTDYSGPRDSASHFTVLMPNMIIQSAKATSAIPAGTIK